MQTGEKLYEELLIGKSYSNQRKKFSWPRGLWYSDWKDLKKHLKQLERYMCHSDIKSIKNLFVKSNIFMSLNKIINNYNPFYLLYGSDILIISSSPK